MTLPCDTARIVAAVLTPDAALYRVGGEEFAVLLPEASRARAVAQAERIRKAVADEPVMQAGRRVPLTVSLGVAELAPGDDPGQLFARADEQLYSSKRAGRNRVS